MSKKYYLARPGASVNSWKVEVTGLNNARAMAQKMDSVIDVFELENKSRFVRIGTVLNNVSKNAIWKDKRTGEVYELYKNGKTKLKLNG